MPVSGLVLQILAGHDDARRGGDDVTTSQCCLDVMFDPLGRTRRVNVADEDCRLIGKSTEEVVVVVVIRLRWLVVYLDRAPRCVAGFQGCAQNGSDAEGNSLGRP